MRAAVLLPLLAACTSHTPDDAVPPPIWMTLDISDPLVRGDAVTFEVHGAPPGSSVRIARSDGVAGTGPCPAFLSGSCFDITPGSSGYLAVLTLQANASGDAVATVVLPALAPLGRSAFQAVVPRASGAGLSNPVVRQIVDNAPPQVSDVVVTPIGPRTTDIVSCTATATDTDGVITSTQHIWDVAGVVVGLGGSLQLSPGRVQPGDNLTCVVVAVDDEGASGLGSQTVTVVNSPPVVAAVSITAASPDTLVCSASVSDVDGGTLVTSYRWDRGVGTTTLQVGATLDLPSLGLVNGDLVRCEATATDAFGVRASLAADAIVGQVETVVPLFDASTLQERPVLEDIGTALVTRFGDRGRDRHAREDVFASYDHYLSHYWEHRTISAEIVDTVGREPDGSVTFHVTSVFPLSPNEAELRFFYRGLNTVAEYHNNGIMTHLGGLEYTRSVSRHGATQQPLQVGDHMEFELSQFLDGSVTAFGGRANYYGTTYLYVVGVGLVPWQADTELGTDLCPCDDEFSTPVPQDGWLGGLTTLPYQYSNEPRDHFMQMATNLAGDNAQPFVLGRRLVHTDFLDGTHSENGYAGGAFIDNPAFTRQIGKLGPAYVNRSCDGCHLQNTRALPPAVGAVLDQYVVRVGDAQGQPRADVGATLQIGDALGASEGSARIARWVEANGLRAPEYDFGGLAPAQVSVRIAPQLVGMGILEAIPENAVLALADPDDVDGDGISGRVHVVSDLVTGESRLGRFGYKASRATVKQQVASALHADLGVMTSMLPAPDCGSAQTGCGPTGVELDDTDLHHLTTYVSLLGMRPQRGLDDPTVVAGQARFSNIGCADCHTPTFQTSTDAVHAEVRDQTVHPYTDLLLHDMGPGLADSLGDGQASGAEWRTAPLWSIGLTPQVNQGEAYLHDGRARTLDEAVRWHGGEGQAAADAYAALAQADRDAVIAFLRSL